MVSVETLNKKGLLWVSQGELQTHREKAWSSWLFLLAFLSQFMFLGTACTAAWQQEHMGNAQGAIFPQDFSSCFSSASKNSFLLEQERFL